MSPSDGYKEDERCRLQHGVRKNSRHCSTHVVHSNPRHLGMVLSTRQVNHRQHKHCIQEWHHKLHILCQNEAPEVKRASSASCRTPIVDSSAFSGAIFVANETVVECVSCHLLDGGWTDVVVLRLAHAAPTAGWNDDVAGNRTRYFW